MLIDVSKYVLTAVVIGGLISERVVWSMVVVGLVMACLIGVMGFWVIPRDREEEST